MMSIESNEKSNDSYHCRQISIDGKDAKNLGDLVGQVLSHFLVFHFLTPQGPPDIMNHDCRWPTEDHLPAQTTHQHLRASTSSPISTAGPQKQQKKTNYDCTPTYTADYQTTITLKIPPKHYGQMSHQEHHNNTDVIFGLKIAPPCHFGKFPKKHPFK